MEYLANPFNHSINPPHNDGICCIFNILSLNLFYYIVASFVCKLDEIQREESVLEGECDVKNIPDSVFDNVFDDNQVDKKVKQKLSSLLDINSLERHYILYYIFKIRGTFYNDTVDININTFAYYKTVLNDWRNIYFSDNIQSLKMNLDNSLENDLQIVIDNLVYNCNIAHIRFISWLYYSGIYNYLMDNLDIKKAVLNDINENKILTGKLFLKYQLLLIDMENIEDKESIDNQGTLDNQDTLDNQEKLETIDEECNTDQECNDDDSNMQYDDDLVEESAIEKSDDSEEDENIDHSIDNENELKNRPITDDFTDMNELTFAVKLLSTVRNITIKTLVSIWKIIKEEMNELFNPVLG